MADNPLLQFLPDSPGEDTTGETSNPLLNFIPETEENPLLEFVPEKEPLKDLVTDRQLINASKLGIGLIMPSALLTYESTDFSQEVKDRTYKAFGQMAKGYGNSVSFGLLNYGLAKAGYQLPESEDAVERSMESIGSLLGFIQGPISASKKIGAKIPIINKLYNPGMAITKPRAMIQSISQGALDVGIASGLMTPETGISDLKARKEQFSEGASMGAMWGVLGLNPNRPTRIASMSALSGVPATLADMPLEDQIFQYGLGAYFGVKGSGLSERVNRAKEFNALKNIVNNGIPYGDGVKQLERSNKQMMSDFEALAVGHEKAPKTKQELVNRLLTSGDIRIDKNGKYTAQGSENWRKQVKKNITKGISKIRKKPDLAFISGTDEFLVNEFSNKKNVNQLNDGQLLELSKHLEYISNKSIDPSKHGISESQLLKKGKFTWWDRIFRPFRGVSKKLGTGDFGEKLLFDQIVADEANFDRYTMRHDNIVNNFKRMGGVSESASTKIFRYIEGRIPASQLSKSQLSAAHQMEQYYDVLLKLNNANRAKKGEVAISKRKNYVTHIQDILLDPYTSASEIPDYVRKNVPQKKIENKFGKQRVKETGFKENVYDSLDAYARSTFRAINDTSVRNISKINNYLTSLEAEHKRTGIDDNVDYKTVKKILTEVSNDFLGKPGPYDAAIQNQIDFINAKLPSKMRIPDLPTMTNFIQNVIYTNALGVRPKLAIRNLGQNSLTIGEAGLKNFVKGVKTSNKKLSQAFQDSLVLTGRKKHFVPDKFDTKTGKFVGKALLMYQGADWINVTNAFKAGYMQETGGKIAKPGTSLHKKAISRGDQVAARTQYLYTRGNRSSLARGLGKSKYTGRLASMFTSWAPNWAELMVTWAREGNREAVARYIALNVGAMALGVATGINAPKYTGLSAAGGVVDLATGQLPAAGVARDPVRIITPGLLGDVARGIKNGNMKEAFFYTFNRG